MPTQSLKATHILIGINVLVFLLMYMFQPEAGIWETFPLYYPRNQQFHLHQFITTLFTHANTGHLLFNMFGLFSFGSVLETIWGAKRFLLFYFIVGIGAGLIYTGVNALEYRTVSNRLQELGVQAETLDLLDKDTLDQFETALGHDLRTVPVTESLQEDLFQLIRLHNVPAVGASGAIYGIFVAFGLLFPDAKLSLIFLPIPIAAKFFIPAILLLDLFSGVTGFSIFGGGIAHFAHLGGALIGFLLMRLWKDQLSLPELPPYMVLDDEPPY